MPSSRTIKEVFLKSQERLSLDTHVNYLKDIYSKSDHHDFTSEYFKLLSVPLGHTKKNELAVTRLLKLTSTFTLRLNADHLKDHVPLSDDDEDDDEAAIHPFLRDLLFFLLKVTDAAVYTSRLNALCLIESIFNGLTELPCEESLLDHLYKMAACRLKDTSASVRAETVLAVSYLQDPTNESCPVIQDFLFLMSHDPHYMTRKNVVQVIAVTSKTLLPLRNRLRDTNLLVRKAALARISEKISVRCFSVLQRGEILEICLRDAELLPVLKEKLVPAWMRACDNDIRSFLKLLDVQLLSKVAQKVLNMIFETDDMRRVVSLLNLDPEKHLLPTDCLNPENAFFWRCLCQYVKKSRSELYLEMFDEITPTISDLCGYLEDFVKVMEQSDAETTLSTLTFIFEQLLLLIAELDFSDKFGVAKLNGWMLDMLKSPISIVPMVESLVNCYYVLQRNPTRCLKRITEVTLEMCRPLVSAESKSEEALSVLLKCLKITIYALKRYRSKGLLRELTELKEILILPCIAEMCLEVRLSALEALALYCFQDVGEAREFYGIFIRAVLLDEHSVKVLALKAAFDIILFFGGALSAEVNPQTSQVVNKDDLNEPFLGNEDLYIVFHEQLLPALDSEEEEIRTVAVEGVGKLLMHGRLASPSLLSRLLLMCFSADYDEDLNIRRFLTSFLPAFACCKYLKLETFPETFDATMETLFNAPSTSCLSRVDVFNVGAAILHLAGLVKSARGKKFGNFIHNDISVRIVKLILQRPRSKRVNSVAKILTHVEVTAKYPEELDSAIEEAIQVVKDKNAIKTIQKFQRKLSQIRLKEVSITEEPSSVPEGEKERNAAETPNNEINTDLPDGDPVGTAVHQTAQNNSDAVEVPVPDMGKGTPDEVVIPESPPEQSSSSSPSPPIISDEATTS